MGSGIGERGMFSVAFHPDYETNGFFYVNYTDNNFDTVVERYSVSANPNVADPTSGLLILAVEQPFPFHNGGQLQFGAANTNGFTKGGVLCNGTRVEIGEPFQLPPRQIFVNAQGNASAPMMLGENRCNVQAISLLTCGISNVFTVP